MFTTNSHHKNSAEQAKHGEVEIFFDFLTLASATARHLNYPMDSPSIFNIALEHIQEDNCEIFKETDYR